MHDVVLWLLVMCSSLGAVPVMTLSAGDVLHCQAE
jgi:hypothetical protein